MPKRWRVDELLAPAAPVDPDALATALQTEVEASSTGDGKG